MGLGVFIGSRKAGSEDRGRRFGFLRGTCSLREMLSIEGARKCIHFLPFGQHDVSRVRSLFEGRCLLTIRYPDRNVYKERRASLQACCHGPAHRCVQTSLLVPGRHI